MKKKKKEVQFEFELLSNINCLRRAGEALRRKKKHTFRRSDSQCPTAAEEV